MPLNIDKWINDPIHLPHSSTRACLVPCPSSSCYMRNHPGEFASRLVEANRGEYCKEISRKNTTKNLGPETIDLRPFNSSVKARRSETNGASTRTSRRPVKPFLPFHEAQRARDSPAQSGFVSHSKDRQQG